MDGQEGSWVWMGIGEDRCVAIPAYKLGRTSEGGGGGEGVGGRVSPQAPRGLGASAPRNTTQRYSSLVYVSLYDLKEYPLISW